MNISSLLDPVKMKELDEQGISIARSLKRGRRVLTLSRSSPRIRKKILRAPNPRVVYDVYIRSPEWFSRKRRYFVHHNRACAVCGSPKVHLHHKTYERLGRERDSDMVALCGFHHKELHAAIGKVKKDMVKETDLLLIEMKNHG